MIISMLNNSGKVMINILVIRREEKKETLVSLSFGRSKMKTGNDYINHLWLRVRVQCWVAT